MGFFPRGVSWILFLLEGLPRWFFDVLFARIRASDISIQNTKRSFDLLLESAFDWHGVGTESMNWLLPYLSDARRSSDTNVLFYMGYGGKLQWAYQQDQLLPCFCSIALQLLKRVYLCALCLIYTNVIFYSSVRCHKSWRQVVPQYYRPI